MVWMYHHPASVSATVELDHLCRKQRKKDNYRYKVYSCECYSAFDMQTCLLQDYVFTLVFKFSDENTDVFKDFFQTIWLKVYKMENLSKKLASVQPYIWKSHTKTIVTAYQNRQNQVSKLSHTLFSSYTYPQQVSKLYNWHIGIWISFGSTCTSKGHSLGNRPMNLWLIIKSLRRPILVTRGYDYHL